MQFFTTLLSALALAASTTTANPIAARGEAIVVTPYITQPVAGDNWPSFSKQIVKWATDAIPPEAYNYTGEILLGFDDGTGSENLSPTPLASGFLLRSGNITVTVPCVQSRDTYFVVLVGDSGNKSPDFTISQPQNGTKCPCD